MQANPIARRFLRLAAHGLFLSTLLAGASQALAQSAYPSRPIRIIVPLTTGGSNDVLARIIADRLTPALSAPTTSPNNLATAIRFSSPPPHTPTSSTSSPSCRLTQ